MASIFADDNWTHEDSSGNRYTVVDREFWVESTYRSMQGDKTASSKRIEKRLSTGEGLIVVNAWTYEIEGSGVTITKRKGG